MDDRPTDGTRDQNSADVVELTGRLLCADLTEASTVRQHLPEHIALTRAEQAVVVGWRDGGTTKNGALANLLSRGGGSAATALKRLTAAHPGTIEVSPTPRTP